MRMPTFICFGSDGFHIILMKISSCSLDRTERSARNALWASVWREVLREDGAASSSLLHLIILLFHHCINSVDLHRANASLAPSRPRDFDDVCSVLEVSHPGTICIWLAAEHPEVSADTICCHASGFLLCSANAHPHSYRIRFGSLDASRFHGSSVDRFDLVMDFMPDFGYICT